VHALSLRFNNGANAPAPFEVLGEKSISIFKILSMQDRSNLRSTCHSFHNLLPPFGYLKQGSWNLAGGKEWEPFVIFHRFPPLVRPINMLFLSVRWKDQGWGNRKSTINMDLVRDNVKVTSMPLFGVADHNWTNKSHILQYESIVFNAQAGDQIEIWRSIGGGGGHHMFIEYLKIIVEFA